MRARWKPFLALYDHYIRVYIRTSDAQGPVSIYSNGNAPLMLRFAARRHCDVDWPVTFKAGMSTPDSMFGIWQTLRILLHMRDLPRLRASFAASMHSIRIPSPRQVLLLVPRSSCVSFCEDVGTACGALTASHSPSLGVVFLDLCPPLRSKCFAIRTSYCKYCHVSCFVKIRTTCSFVASISRCYRIGT